MGSSKYSLIVVADPDALSSAAARRIHSYVAAGGAVLATLGETLNGDNPLLGELNAGEVRNRSGKVGEVASTHPVLREATDWNRVRFFRQRAIQPTADDKTLIALDDGTPLLIERALGAGRMLILTMPVDRRWNDLAIHPLFVQFIGAAASYLTHAEATAASALVGATVTTGLTEGGGGQIFDPQGRRVLGLAQSTTDRLIPDQAGFYEIRGSEGARWLAVNVDTRESDLATLPAGFCRALAGVACTGVRARHGRGSNSRSHAEVARPLVAVAGRHSVASRSVAGESPSGHSSRGAKMTSRERLEGYLAALRRRLRSHIYLQAGAAAAAGTLLVTCFAVWLFNQEEFAPSDCDFRTCCVSGSVSAGCSVAVVAAAATIGARRRLTGARRAAA